MTARPFYLFLDCDGVLHHAGDSPRLFEYAARLAALLGNYPEVQVVEGVAGLDESHLGHLEERLMNHRRIAADFERSEAAREAAR